MHNNIVEFGCIHFRWRTRVRLVGNAKEHTQWKYHRAFSDANRVPGKTKMNLFQRTCCSASCVVLCSTRTLDGHSADSTTKSIFTFKLSLAREILKGKLTLETRSKVNQRRCFTIVFVVCVVQNFHSVHGPRFMLWSCRLRRITKLIELTRDWSTERTACANAFRSARTIA